MAGCRRQWSSEHLTAAPSSAIIFTIVSWPPPHPRTGVVSWIVSPWRVSQPNMRCRRTRGTSAPGQTPGPPPGRLYPQMWDGYNLIWIFLLCHQFTREYKQPGWAVLSYYRVLPPPRSPAPQSADKNKLGFPNGSYHKWLRNLLNPHTAQPAAAARHRLCAVQGL